VFTPRGPGLGPSEKSLHDLQMHFELVVKRSRFTPAGASKAGGS
jgi:hypothetical protein